MLKIVHEEWLMELNNFTITDIKRGLKKWIGDYPPNVVEFVKACKPYKNPAPYYKSYPENALPPPCNKDKGIVALDEIRRLLKKEA